MIIVDSKACRVHLQEISPKLRDILAEKVNGFSIGLQSYIVGSNLQGGTPLHRRSGTLSDSITVGPIEQTQHSVSQVTGTNVEYAHVHELGGTFDIREHLRRMTLSGITGQKHDALVTVRAHQATYPKRAFMKPSVQEKSGEFTQAVAEAVAESIK